MTTKNKTIRMDENPKEELEKILDEFSLNMTTFFTMAAKQCIFDRKLPFGVSKHPKQNMDTD